MMLCKYYKN